MTGPSPRFSTPFESHHLVTSYRGAHRQQQDMCQWHRSASLSSSVPTRCVLAALVVSPCLRALALCGGLDVGQVCRLEPDLQQAAQDAQAHTSSSRRRRSTTRGKTVHSQRDRETRSPTTIGSSQQRATPCTSCLPAWLSVPPTWTCRPWTGLRPRRCARAGPTGCAARRQTARSGRWPDDAPLMTTMPPTGARQSHTTAPAPTA